NAALGWSPASFNDGTPAYGGAIAIVSGDLQVRGSTFTANRAVGGTVTGSVLTPPYSATKAAMASAARSTSGATARSTFPPPRSTTPRLPTTRPQEGEAKTPRVAAPAARAGAGPSRPTHSSRPRFLRPRSSPIPPGAGTQGPGQGPPCRAWEARPWE